jgi:hypothetical protein
MVDTIRTQTDLLDVFKDDQAPGSIVAQDVRDLIVSGPLLLESVYGWEFILDAEYISQGLARSITGGTKTQVTMDGLAENSRYLAGFQGAWNTTTNKVDPGLLNGFGIIRFAVSAWSDAGATNRFDVELDAGTLGGSPIVLGSPQLNSNVIYQQTAVFSKGTGASNAQSFNFIIPLFVGPDFATNGATLFITPQNDASFYQFAFTGIRLFVPNPAS